MNHAHTERELYGNICSELVTVFLCIEDETDFYESHNSCAFDVTMHYSFDYAQQMHIPSNVISASANLFQNANTL